MRNLILLFLLTTFQLSSQSNKSIDFGINAPLSYDSRIPAFAFSPNINYCTGKHQFQIGMDVYENLMKADANNIIGLQAAYKRLLLNEKEKFNVFIDFNLQYVQYGVGLRNSVPYSYQSTNYFKIDYNMIRNKSFINTLGVGIKTTFLKRVSFLFVISGGYNYYQSDYSPSNITHKGMYLYEVNDAIKPIVYMRIGLNVQLWKSYKNNQPQIRLNS